MSEQEDQRPINERGMNWAAAEITRLRATLSAAEARAVEAERNLQMRTADANCFREMAESAERTAYIQQDRAEAAEARAAEAERERDAWRGRAANAERELRDKDGDHPECYEGCNASEFKRQLAATREALEESNSLLVACMHERRPLSELEAQIHANRAALSDAPAPVSVEDWRDIASAPKDGTRILAWCVHPNDRYASDDSYRGPVVAHWIDHNGGGWTWYGHLGQFTHWRPLPPAPSQNGGDRE